MLTPAIWRKKCDFYWSYSK